MGSFQRMVDAFLTALRRNGGDAIDKVPVARIHVQDGAVTGVETDDGTRYSARVVISNADAHQTFGTLIGREHLPERFVKRMDRMTPSLSAFCVYAATSQDVTEHFRAHETFKYNHWDHEDTWRDVLDGGRPAGMSLSVMTMMDPSLAPAGQHLLIGTAVAPYVRGDGKKWSDDRDRFADALLGEFETLCPGLRENLSFRQGGSPLTIERFTRNHRGATYGWALSPSQIGGKRLAHDTPIGGLFLSGHWTEEGPASFRVVLSGMNTSRMVLGHLGSDMTVPTFRPDDVPQLAL
jgi:prolycopene isomerase